MQGEERRRKILSKLSFGKGPIAGAELAKEFSVSRQVIVQDVAVLRAEGNDIISTNKGYLLPHYETDRTDAVRGTFPCVHQQEDILEELYTIVDMGGKVIDVTVEHSYYGELKGSLWVESRRDADEFVEKLTASDSEPLSNLTGGVHLHTVEAPDKKRLQQIWEALEKKGFIVK